MSEWFKEHAWKACVRATVPEVRILSLPPFFCITGSLSRVARFFLPLASAIFLYHRFVTERSEVTFPATSAILLYRRFVISRSEIFSSSRFRQSNKPSCMLGLLDCRSRTKRFVISRSEIFSSSRFRLSPPHPFTTFFVTSNFSIYFPTINRVCA